MRRGTRRRSGSCGALRAASASRSPCPRRPRPGSGRRAAVGRRRAEEVLEHPLAAQHRRGPRRVGRDRQHAGLGQHAAARRPGEVDAAELRSGDAGDAVVPRQPLVEEGVAAVEEVEDAAVLADQRSRRTARSRAASRSAGSRRTPGTARGRGSATRARGTAATGRRTPPPGARARVLQHAPHLRLEHRRAAAASARRRAQSARHRACSPRGNRTGARRARAGRSDARDPSPQPTPILLDAEEEVGRDEHGLHRHGQPFLERFAAAPRRRREPEVGAGARRRVTGRRNARRASVLTIFVAHHA